MVVGIRSQLPFFSPLVPSSVSGIGQELMREVALVDRIERAMAARSFGALGAGAGSIPPPSLDLSGAPAGLGLDVGPAGWPGSAIGTAGGYRIAPWQNGWGVYQPGQMFGESPWMMGGL